MARRKSDKGSVVGGGSWLSRMINRPAQLASVKALLLGVAWLIIGSIGGWYFDLVPTSSFGYTWASLSLLWSLLANLTVWISSTVLFFAVAVIRNRKVGTVDIFGRMLFAHWPALLLMLPGIVGDKIAYATYMTDPAVAFSNAPFYAVLMSIIVAVILVWTLYWGYLAFSRASQRSGVVTFVLYVVIAAFSYILSDATLDALYSSF